MKTNALKSFLGVLLFVAFFLAACSTPHRTAIDPVFKKWVSGYTSGIVSNQENILIELQNPVDSIHMRDLKMKTQMDSSALLDLIEITPEIKFSAKWRNDRTIEIKPLEILESNKLYNVAFNLEAITQVEDGYEDFVFQFATKPLTLQITSNDLSIEDSYNIEWYKLTTDFYLSDFVDTSKLKQLFTVSYDGQTLPFRIETRYGENEYSVVVDSIKRGDTEKQIILSYDGKPIHANSKGKETIFVKALGDFDLTETRVENNDNQQIILTFSEQINLNQDLTGLIELEGIKDLKFSQYYNQITVYLPNRIEGKRELQIHKGILNHKNYGMKKSYTRALQFTGADPKVRLVGNGNILPDSKGLIFPFETISLKSVSIRIVKIYESNVHHFLQVNDLSEAESLFRFGKKLVEKRVNLHVDSASKNQWVSHVLNLEQWIKPELGAIYRVSIKFEKKDAYCDCPTNPNETDNDDASEKQEESWSERPWYMDDWDDGYDNWGGYNDNPCEDGYYYGRAVARNILASNIGLIYKLDAQHVGHVFVTDMITSQPLSGASISFYDYVKQTIASGVSNDQGMVELKLNEKPFLLVAKYGKQRGYLKVGDSHTKSLTEFDILGETVDNGIKGYIYADRGVWRPGDSIYVNFILRDYDQKLPPNHPVIFTLTDPMGAQLYTVTKTTNVNGHYDFRCTTDQSGKTGVYTAEVQVGSRTFTKYLKVETVKPNRLKMKLTTPNSTLVDSGYTLSANWLHGAVASNLTADVQVEYHSMKTEIPNYRTFIFDSPIRHTNSEQRTIFNGNLSKTGKAHFEVNQTSQNNESGFLKAIYTTRVFENGGNFSIDRFTEVYSPFQQYVGIQLPKSEADNSLLAGKKHAFNLVVSDDKGNLIKENAKLHVSIYQLEWQWWYDGTEDDFSNFMAKNGNLMVYDTLLIAEKGKSQFKFGLPEKNYGRFMVLVTDEKGNHQTGEVFKIDMPYWLRGNQQNNSFASMLSFTTDKKNYVRGETVKLSIPSPANGKALISIETRKKIVKKFWVNTVKGETNCSFEATEAMTPNVYIHVSLIQPHASTANDLPIRMYGILPILVENPETHLEPIIKTSKEWEPESKVSVQISEKHARGMTYTLAIVDEGLLDLTRFKTPNPWPTFYAKEALGIQTWDVYDDVLGAYTGKMNRMISIGGDESANDGAGPKANRFKPMVTFLGPFVLGSGQHKTHQIDIPRYMGSVRIMVVAHAQLAFGSSELAVPVRKPLMILGTLPRVLSPNELVALPVDIFSTVKTKQDVTITASGNEMISFEEAKGSVRVDPEGNEMVFLKMKVNNKQGIAKIELKAKSQNYTAAFDFEVDVRPPNPVVIESDELWLEPGKSHTFDTKQLGVPGSHTFHLEISKIAPLNLAKRMNELIVYPHGCVEQTTSSVFPQLLALELVNCTSNEKKQMSDNVTQGIKRLQLFQTSSGGLAYWPGESYASDWGSNYAGHFILLAEKQGFKINERFKNAWLAYQKEAANQWTETVQRNYGYHTQASNEAIQAYRLYTLALAGKPEIGAMNRLKEKSNLSNPAKWRLAAAYFMAGYRNEAQKLVSSADFNVDKYRELSFSYGSDTRDLAMILEAAYLLDRKGTDALEKLISEKLNSSTWLSTQETAYCLLALGSKTGLTNPYPVSINKEKTTIDKRVYTRKIKEKLAEGKYTITNLSNKKIHVNFATQYIPQQGKEKTNSSKLKMEVSYIDLKGVTLDPKKIKQGSDFIMRIEISNPSKNEYYREMALSQIIPGGWEILNTRYMEGGITSTVADYEDIRDDRVYSYFKLAPNEKKIFTLQLNASYLGKFYIPAIYCEAMYDRTIHAQQQGKWVEVSK